MEERDYTSRRETVRLRHPHTGDVREVQATSDEIVPLMGLGYEQVREESE